jgi:hypothetical protein
MREEVAPAPPVPPRRSAGKWVILLIAWVVGLGVWGVYIAMIVTLAFRWFA